MPKKRPARTRKPTPPVVVQAPPSPQVVGMVKRVAAKTGSRLYRTVETFAFVAAIVELLAYQTIELLHRAEVMTVNQAHEGFPWGTLISSVILISPKLIGKAFAGRALVAIAGGGGSSVTAEQEASKGGE